MPVDELTAKPDGSPHRHPRRTASNSRQQWPRHSLRHPRTSARWRTSRRGVVGRCDPRTPHEARRQRRFPHTAKSSVAYRGIFLNDEDWSLQPWSWQTFELAEPAHRTESLSQNLRTAAAVRAPTPSGPGCMDSPRRSISVPGAKEAADSCGIVIGTSHCEPLMRNNVGEWDTARRGPYNYITNRDSVQAYWVERLKEVRDAEILHHRDAGHPRRCDGGVSTLTKRPRPCNGSSATSADCPKAPRPLRRKDSAGLPALQGSARNHGERPDVPDDVTLMWCDDNYGYLTRLSDSTQQRRSGGAGVYYHLSYWGRPHDYLWLTTTQPGPHLSRDAAGLRP